MGTICIACVIGTSVSKYFHWLKRCFQLENLPRWLFSRAAFKGSCCPHPTQNPPLPHQFLGIVKDVRLNAGLCLWQRVKLSSFKWKSNAIFLNNIYVWSLHWHSHFGYEKQFATFSPFQMCPYQWSPWGFSWGLGEQSIWGSKITFSMSVKSHTIVSKFLFFTSGKNVHLEN